MTWFSRPKYTNNQKWIHIHFTIFNFSNSIKSYGLRTIISALNQFIIPHMSHLWTIYITIIQCMSTLNHFFVHIEPICVKLKNKLTKVEWFHIKILSTRLPHLWWIWNKWQGSIFLLYIFTSYLPQKWKLISTSYPHRHFEFLTKSDGSHINLRNVTDRYNLNILDKRNSGISDSKVKWIEFSVTVIEQSDR